MKISNIFRLLPIISCVAFISSCQSLKKSDSENNSAKTTIAEYNGGKITLRDAELEIGKIIAKNSKLTGLKFNNLTTDQQESLVKDIVLRKVLAKEAKKRGLHKTENYETALDLFETQLLQQELLVDLAKEAKAEENLKKKYDELVKDMASKEDFRISYIVVKKKSEATSIHRYLKKHPKYFASQAKNKSLDKETAKKGGDLGFVMEDILPQQILSKVKELKEGEITSPIEIGDQWVIVKLAKRRTAEILPYEEAKENLANNLAQKSVQDFVVKSLEDAKIKLSID